MFCELWTRLTKSRVARASLGAVALGLLALGGCVGKSGNEPVTLRVGMSPEFAPVLRSLARDYTARQPWVQVAMVQANTARLEIDMQSGQKFDLYIPGRAESVLAMRNSDAVAPASVRALGNNQLVLVAAPDSPLPMSFNALMDPRVAKIAVVNPTGNHLGRLTGQALASLRLVPPTQAPSLVGASMPPSAVNTIEDKLLVVDKEMDVLEAVRNGQAQVGITFGTFATAERSLRTLAPLPAFTHAQILYLAAIPRNAPHYDEAWNFLNYLQSLQARALLQREGIVLDQTPSAAPGSAARTPPAGQ